MANEELDGWFVQEVLPLEPLLSSYLRRNWPESSEIPDLRQEVYVRVYEAAGTRRPAQAKPFVFATARNLLIDRARRAKVVSIEAVADLDSVDAEADFRTPERHVSARMELRLLQRALDQLPSRCGEVVRLRFINGLSHREVASTMGISQDTVEKQLAKALRAMAGALLQTGLKVITQRKAPGVAQECERSGLDGGHRSAGG